jgi:hypothetical protein
LPTGNEIKPFQQQQYVSPIILRRLSCHSLKQLIASQIRLSPKAWPLWNLQDFQSLL